MKSAYYYRFTLELYEAFQKFNDILKGFINIVSPIMDFIARIYIAKSFLGSAIVKLSNWNATLYLAQNEYPVSWMAPHTAAITWVSIELIFSALLILGLMTRISAALLLLLSIIIQYNYQALNTQSMWIILLLWYVIFGSGGLSIDHALKGFKDSALPLSAPISQFFSFLKDKIGPIYIALVRFWIVVVFITTSVTLFSPESINMPLAIFKYNTADSVFYYFSATHFQKIVFTFCMVLIFLGFFTRLTSLFLVVYTAVLVGMVKIETDLQYNEFMYWLFIFSFLMIKGAKTYSLDRLIISNWIEKTKLIRLNALQEGKKIPHVVIIGGGFGGIAAAKELRNTACRISIIDKHNYHLFQPLLYQVATAGLSPAEIAVPIRSLFNEQPNVKITMGEVIGIDKTKKEIVLKNDKKIGYDFLVLATGAMHSYFGRDEWAQFAPGMKSIDDAISVRQTLLEAFEKAENNDGSEHDYLLSFIIIGGGPTGIELAGALAELAFQGMENEFRNIDPKTAKIYLIEAGPRILGTMHPTLSAYTQKALEALGVKVLVNTKVENITKQGVMANGEKITAANVLWAAGVQASYAAKWLDAKADQAGRLIVNNDMSVPDTENIFAIGDTVSANVWNSSPMPGLAAAAKQSGKFVANKIRSIIEGKKILKNFKYIHYGSLATIGRKLAVVDFGAFRLRGTLAWWFWGGIHLYFLNNMRNRLQVMLQWFWFYLTFKKSSRIIYEESEQ